jgi:hypothetical protein
VPDEALVVSDGFKVGAQIAAYVLREQVGTGAVATVYRAYDVRLDRWVALKMLAPGIAPGDPFRQRLIRESRAAAAIGHPHIIPVFEAGEADGVLFIAMRYVGGGDAGTLVRRLGPLDPARVASIIAQVASGLDAAHAAGLVHGQVRPASMLLAAAAADSPSPDHVYLSDFGFSAPQADDRGDLIALARAAREMLTGQQPTSGQESGAGPGPARPAPLTSLRPDLPPGIGQVLAQAMAEPPDGRYQDCREFAADLLEACGLERDASAQPPADHPVAGTSADPPGAATRADPPGAATRADPLPGVPRADPLPGVPRADPLPGVPRADPLPGVPRADPLAGVPRADPLAGVPRADPLAGVPRADPLAGFPRATPASPGLQAAPLMAAGPAGAEIALARRRLAAYESAAPELAVRKPAAREPAVLLPYSAVPYPAEPPVSPYPAEPPPPGSFPPPRYAPAPPRRPPAPPRRSPVIAAAILVVILAVAGAAFLALRGGGAPSPHAGLPPAAGGQADSGSPGSSAQRRHVSRSSHAGPGSQRRRIRHVRPASPGDTSSPGSTSKPSGASTPSSTSSPGTATSPASSAATVSAYIAAINARDYARAWSLGGRSSSPSYAAFVRGFGSTASDTLTILSANGSVVTAQLAARQTDGAVITYQGTYTVDDGVIVASDIKQTG